MSTELTISEKLTRDDPLIASFALTNSGAEPVTLLKRGLPFDSYPGGIFKVFLEGERIPYRGPLGKRVEVRDSDFLVINPGETVVAEYNLSLYFSFEDEGDYDVLLRHPSIRLRGGGKVDLPQEARSLRVHLATGESGANAPPVEVGSKEKSNARFHNCNADERRVIRAAELVAIDMLELAEDEARQSSMLVDHVFHGEASATWIRERSDEVLEALIEGDGTVDYDCDGTGPLFEQCSDGGAVAWVYPWGSTMYLCDAFFEAPLHHKTYTQAATKAATVVHELAHMFWGADDDALTLKDCGDVHDPEDAAGCWELFNSYNWVLHVGEPAQTGDFDGDGFADLFLIDPSNRSWAFFSPKTHTNSVTTIHTFSATALALEKHNVRVGDFDGDGLADVFYRGGTTGSGDLGAPCYILYAASGWSTPVQALSTQVHVAQMKVGDFNGDGKDDLLYHNGSQYRISDNGTSAWRNGIGSSVEMSRIQIGDINRDGQDDLFSRVGTTGTEDWRYVPSATGTWTYGLRRSGVGIQDLHLADFTNNGFKDDVLASTGANWLVSHRGTSTWATANTANDREIVLADFLPSSSPRDYRDDVGHFERVDSTGVLQIQISLTTSDSSTATYQTFTLSDPNDGVFLNYGAVGL